MNLSVVVPVHDKATRLRLTLAGLSAQTSVSFELIIVADNPTEQVRQVISDFPSTMTVESGGVGRAGARNAGARLASGDVLVFVDDDILVKPDFLMNHQQAQRRRPGLLHGSLRELIGLLKIVDPADGGPGCPPIRIEDLKAGLWQPGSARLITSALEQAAEHAEADRWPWLACAGANISVPRYIWRSVGGFDESYGLSWGMEDIDFAYRLWQKGVPIALLAEAPGYHMSHYNPDRWEQHRANLARFHVRAQSPEALALGELLGPGGSVLRYRSRIAQILHKGSAEHTRA